MEYSILGISDTSTLEDARQALNKVRLAYHPDKGIHLDTEQSARNARFLQLAEEAYHNLKQKERVNSSIRHMQNSMDNMLSRMSMDHILARRSAHATSSYSYENRNGVVRESGGINGQPTTTSYSYENRNGVVRESGWINGQPMTTQQLQVHRSTHKLQ